jgi:hypothetical protein
MWYQKPRIVTLEIGHADLDAAATYQSFDFAAALPDYAKIEAVWSSVTEVFGSTGTATAATKTFGNAETYSLTDGQTVLVAVDGGGEDTGTFNFAAGTQECSTYFPVSDLDGLQISVVTDGGAAEVVTFATPCTTSAHVRAQIAAQTTGLAVSQATTAKAAQAFGTTAATWALTNGLTVIIDVDDAGAATATWAAVRAVSSGSGLAIVDIDTETLTVKIDGGAVQTITFGAGDTTAATAAATINAQLSGGSAVVNAGEIDIYSDTYGTNSIVEITGGTAATELGQSVAVNTEATSDAADCSVATFAEIKTWLEGDISGMTVTESGDNKLIISSDTTGGSSKIDIQASTALTILGLSVAVTVGTADQPKLTSDTLGTGSSIAVTDVDSGLTWGAAVAGTGDAVDSTVVTAAEVNTVLEADIAGVTMSVDTGAPVMTSDTTGASSSLNFGAGTANTALGLADETLTGADAVNGTATLDVGISGGDVDKLIDGADINAATGIIDTPLGALPTGMYWGDTIAARIDSNVNVDQLTTGAMIVKVMYRDLTTAFKDQGQL